MVTVTDNHKSSRIREYDRAYSVVFLKTKERYGALSNMAGGFPLRVNGVDIRTSEALYQACRFPHLPKIQNKIIAERSPMTAKMKSKPHRQNSRSDWDAVRVKIMRWCLQVKLAQNWDRFRDALLETENLPIVEHSRRDDFWGAKPVDDTTLVGVNALGRLLMELREQIKKYPPDVFQYVEPLPIPEFLLCGRQIGKICQFSIDNKRGKIDISKRQPVDAKTKSPATMVAEVASGYSTTIAECTRININTAHAVALQSFLGITPKLAEKIEAYREDKGPFPTVASIVSVHGIGKKTYQKISDMITVDSHIPNTQPSLLPDF